MRITIRQTTALPSTLTELAHSRFVFALGRFGARVQSLNVRLRDLHGASGGHDKLCTVAVRLIGSRRAIVVEETDANTATAIDRAAERTARAVSRAVDVLDDWRPGRRRER